MWLKPVELMTCQKRRCRRMSRAGGGRSRYELLSGEEERPAEALAGSEVVFVKAESV